MREEDEDRPDNLVMIKEVVVSELQKMDGIRKNLTSKNKNRRKVQLEQKFEVIREPEDLD